MLATLQLNDQWTFRQVGKREWLPATVPGTVHTDLIANDSIPDPFFRTNEKNLQWIDKVDWEYQTTFDLPADWLERDAITLECLGLDTYADVYLNDSLVLLADNFFCHWEKEVKSRLRPGKNHLRVYFHSPTRTGAELLARHGYALPAVNDQSEIGEMGDKRVSVFVRKPGYHFGWDWGPRLVTSGIYRPIRLKAWNKARLTDVFFQQKDLTDDQAQLVAQCSVVATAAERAELQIWQQDTLLTTQTVDLQPGSNAFQLPFSIFRPVRWWTHDLGKPHLYALTAKLLQRQRPLDTLTHRVGLRTMRVVQTPDKTGRGSSFYLELNGRPIFSKGANYIPNDVFIPRVSSEQYGRVIAAATDANMNVLRVWGGGFYENDEFYNRCDEAGLLVWQDFMFACSMYPGDPAFLRSIEDEARYNLQRLRNHPCIALWCGNNEIDQAWSQYQEYWGWGWKQQYNNEQRKEIWADYQAIFHQLLPKLVGAHHPGAFYWPSSPYARAGTHATNSSTSGDIHYWGVWVAEQPFTAFYDNIGRYMSEYGFQSFPEWRTIQSFTTAEDWNIESPVMMAHQRSGIGNLRIRHYLQQHYRMPTDFQHFLYVAQLVQAEGIRMAIEAHRSAMPYCMGSLYWQINDVWPVASWSSTDYFQRWKALHYFVKKAFAPTITAARRVEDRLRLTAVSDQSPSPTGRLKLRLLDFQGQLRWEQDTAVALPNNNAAIVWEKPVATLADTNLAKQVVLVADLFDDQNHLVHQNLIYLVSPKQLELPKTVQFNTAIRWENDCFVIRLQTDQLAKNVYLESGAEQEGFFSDNYFDLLPGVPVEVTFTPRQGKMEQLDLRITPLQKTY